MEDDAERGCEVRRDVVPDLAPLVVPRVAFTDADVKPDQDAVVRVRLWSRALAGTLLRRLLYAALANPRIVPLRRYRGKLYGREYETPRTMATFSTVPGLTYKFSGIAMEVASPMPAAIDALRCYVERLTGAPYNFVLINRYTGGTDKVDWHADDEASIVPGSTIASVTLNAPSPTRGRTFARKFQWRRVKAVDGGKLKRTPVSTVELADGDILTMEGAMQAYYHHRVPAGGTQGGRPRIPPDAVRYNFTFRLMKTSSAAPGRGTGRARSD